ncbi:Carbon monoxide dehydrogenase medium chain [Cupriavidus yeoncheonensis]|uniref:Carbon monoxide dehydrogenase medium chain n=1 Tax=Cupriavidus yeoncheonensis TaxID=1462994 RepID=A0A916IVU5_9BURK|nr:xanthine dehydrogenase family protein subunit M [Cupriavidus yeoncheonensis]CAG2150841.1 Carbon monoxide dehydrogenase medium chain [Cupriavidus yeoncheonensis]
MIPYPVDYVRATSVAHALELLSGDSEARLLAGGHSLIPLMKLRLASTPLLIDIGRLPELQGIEFHPDHIAIGAVTTHAELGSHAELAALLPLIPLAAGVIADPTVRNRGTIGGSLVNADPSADWPAVMLALDARMELTGTGGTRELAADAFFVGVMTSAVQPDELLTRIRIPLPGPDRVAYRKFRHPASGYAVAATAVALRYDGHACTGGAIGVTGVADSAFRAHAAEAMLGGFTGSAEQTRRIVEAAFADVRPLEDGFADGAYRMQLARVMLGRALADAVREP